MKAWAATSAGARAAVLVLGAGAVTSLGWAGWQVMRPIEPAANVVPSPSPKDVAVLAGTAVPQDGAQPASATASSEMPLAATEGAGGAAAVAEAEAEGEAANATPLASPADASADPGVEPAVAPADVPRILTWAVTSAGTATIAGEAPPGAQLRIMVNGALVAETRATPGGEFAVMATLAPNPSPSLMTLVMTDANGGERASPEAVALGPIIGAVAQASAPQQGEVAQAPAAAALDGELGNAPDAASDAAASAPAEPSPADLATATTTADTAAPQAPAALLVTEDGAVTLRAAPAPADPSAAAISAPAGSAAKNTAAADDTTQAAVAAGAAAQAAPSELSLDAISYTASGEVGLSGKAQAHAFLRLYLDGVRLQDAEASGAGNWNLILADVVPGTYQLRIDQLDASGKVIARFETPFLRETREALASASATGSSQSPAGPEALTQGADATAALPHVPEAEAAPAALAAQSGPAVADPLTAPVVPPPVTVTVQPGHTLWAIARGEMGQGIMYVQVYEANRDKIGDPDLIYPGQVFSIPGQ